MALLLFPDEFTIRLTGSGKLAQELREYYDLITTGVVDTNADLTCEVRTLNYNPEEILGKPTDYYGREGDWLIRRDKHKKIRIKNDWSEIQFSPTVPRAWAFKILEFFVRHKLSKKGYSLIHASGVRVGDTTLAFPAWRHTGKTNTLMSLIREQGADYLSDDRLWLGRDGTSYGFPLPINLQPYNYNAFPHIDPPTRFYDKRYQLSNLLHSVSSESGSFFSRALHFLNEFYISPPSKKVKIEEIYQDVEYINKASLDTLVCLQTVGGDSPTVELTEISSEKAVAYLQSISHHEWNSMIQKYMSAFDILFDEREAMSELQELIQTEKDIWSDTLTKTPTYRLTIPREEQWHREELSEAILKELSSTYDS